MILGIICMLVLVYAICLGYIVKKPTSAGKKILLIIEQRTSIQNLEWLVYSFKKFAEHNFPDYHWIICMDVSDPEKKEMLVRLAARFNLQFCESVPNPKNFQYIFWGRNSTFTLDWQQQLDLKLKKAN